MVALLICNQVPVEVTGVYDEQTEELGQALCGDNVRIRLKGVSDDAVQPGYVLTSSIKPIRVATQFEAQLAIVESKNIICAGYSCVLHIHTTAEEVTLTVSVPPPGLRAVDIESPCVPLLISIVKF